MTKAAASLNRICKIRGKKSLLKVDTLDDQRTIIWKSDIRLDNDVKKTLELILLRTITQLHKEFLPNKILASINKYFFFPGVDSEDLDNCHCLLQDYLLNISILEKRIMNHDSLDFCEIKLASINFSKNFNLLVNILVYLKNAYAEIMITDKKVEIYVTE